MACVENRNGNSPNKEMEAETLKERLSKRLAYILRYAALREGLQVDDNGFVDLQELLLLPMLARFSEEEIMEVITTSQSHRGNGRFDCVKDNEKTLVRASYGRKLDKNPRHDGTQVLTLFESSIQVILKNLGMYDLTDFPDDYLIGFMLNRLARQKKLNNAALKVLLVPVLEHLNLQDVFLTQNTLRIIYAQCSQLKTLSLRNCGYIVTDAMLNQLTKKLVYLEFINVTGCHHLTDNGINCLSTNLPRLAKIGMSMNKRITSDGVINLLKKAPSLKLLDVYGLKASEEARQVIDQIRTERKIVVILSGLQEKDENGVETRIKPTYPKGVM